MGISIIKIRLSWDCLNLYNGNACTGKTTSLYWNELLDSILQVDLRDIKRRLQEDGVDPAAADEEKLVHIWQLYLHTEVRCSARTLGPVHVLPVWSDTVTSQLANGSAAFIWKLHHHWLRGFWQRHIAIEIKAPEGHFKYNGLLVKAMSSYTFTSMNYATVNVWARYFVRNFKWSLWNTM